MWYQKLGHTSKSCSQTFVSDLCHCAYQKHKFSKHGCVVLKTKSKRKIMMSWMFITHTVHRRQFYCFLLFFSPFALSSPILGWIVNRLLHKNLIHIGERVVLSDTGTMTATSTMRLCGSFHGYWPILIQLTRTILNVRNARVPLFYQIHNRMNQLQRANHNPNQCSLNEWVVTDVE